MAATARASAVDATRRSHSRQLEPGWRQGSTLTLALPCPVVRVVFYTHTAYFEPALGLIQALSRLAELHVLLEVSPAAWRLAAFDVSRQDLPSGIVAADPVLRHHFRANVRRYWQDAVSFHLVVHNARKFFHPSSWRVSHEVIRFVRKLGPTVLHVDSAPLRLGLVVPEWPAVPVVLSEHDPELHSGEHDWRTHLARWLSYRRVDRFIVHNHALREAFSRRYRIPEGRIAVVRLGTYDLFRELLAQPGAADDRTVLFFGRLSHYKGLDVLYQAAPDVASRVPGVRFVVAGRPVAGYHLPPPPVLANGARLEVVSQYISNARLAELFDQATVVVCPYTDASQSGVVLTAYAFNTPVIATAIGGLPEYVRDGETGLLVPAGDAAALGEALVKVLTQPSLRAQLADGLRARRTDVLDWGRAARETLAVYASISSNR